MGNLELAATPPQGDICEVAGPSPLPAARVFEATDADSTCLTYTLLPGDLARYGWLTCDLLLESDTTAAFQFRFFEPGSAEPFVVQFMPLIHAQARVRVPLAAMDMNRWALEREGAWLKPMCFGRRVDAALVDRITLAVIRTGRRRVRFSLTPPTLTDAEPPLLTGPLLPRGALIDRLGQCAVRDWPGKTRGQVEMVERLKRQLHDGALAVFPEGFSRWGGCMAERGRQTGYFRVEKTGDCAWRFVDPEGCAWWSAGLDCVRPEIQATVEGLERALEETPHGGAYGGCVSKQRGKTSVNYLGVNLRRAFGDPWPARWAALALGQLKAMGFNTVANWSQWQIAREARFPYVRPLDWSKRIVPRIYRDFPDVFDPVFEQEAAVFAQQLGETRDDPALVGYFLMNEPTWGFSPECPAAAMLFTHETSHTRERLAKFLAERHGTDEGLARAWDMPVTFEAVRTGIWKTPLTPAAQKDLEAFGTLMADRLFTTLSNACRVVDPHHLNLGIRYAGEVPVWALAGMTAFDVFSINMYRETVSDDLGDAICRVVDRPLLIGEWHFGALDAGLPSTGIGHVPTQADRGRAYRVYLEDAAAKPWCVGVHYFTMYDQSAIGRYDGENYNIGFLDVCHRPYEELAAAARRSHERMYRVRAGEVAPYDERPRYLPKVFS